MMKTIGMSEAMVIVIASAVWVLQTPQFELVQKDLFVSGGTSVNVWADDDADGDPDLFVGSDLAPAAHSARQAPL